MLCTVRLSPRNSKSHQHYQCGATSTHTKKNDANIFCIGGNTSNVFLLKGSRTNWRSEKNSARQYLLQWWQHLQRVSSEGGRANWWSEKTQHDKIFYIGESTSKVFLLKVAIQIGGLKKLSMPISFAFVVAPPMC